jgi:vacuolar-type H+-ATPase subunit I/STV1
MSERSFKEKFPLLYAKFSQGLTLLEDPTYTEERIQELGGLPGIKAEGEAREERIDSELQHTAYWNFKQETIGAGGFFKIPKSLAEVKESLANSSVGQFESEKEDCEIEVQNIDEITTTLSTSVFSTRVKEDFEKTGVVSICMTHLGHDSIETLRGEQYENLVAFTNEEIAMLAEVRAYFTELMKLYKEELAERETRMPGELKTLQKKGKDLAHAGQKASRELEKITRRFTRDRSPQNREDFRRLWDRYNELTAEHQSVLNEIHALNPQAEIVEFPEISSDVRYAHQSIGKLGIK